MNPRHASGRIGRPLALLAVSIAALAPAAAGAAVRPTQPLVALLRAHVAHASPTVWSPRIGVVPAVTPITEEQTTLPVLSHRGRWLQVRLPGRPNGHTGWIQRTGTKRFTTDWQLVVTLSQRSLTVYHLGAAVHVFLAVVGKPATPTPTGHFFVEESIALTTRDVGAPFALALSARSRVLQEFDGGPGQIALHGLGNVGGIPGTAVSHGCVRLSTDSITWLSQHIGPGVPVTIVR